MTWWWWLWAFLELNLFHRMEHDIVLMAVGISRDEANLGGESIGRPVGGSQPEVAVERQNTGRLAGGTLPGGAAGR